LARENIRKGKTYKAVRVGTNYSTMGALKLTVLEEREKRAKLRVSSVNGVRKISACSCPCYAFRKEGVITMDVSVDASWNID